jgi:hypothetical protein
VSGVLARRPATPYARRLARERGLVLSSITGSGPDGRIVAADIEAYAARRREVTGVVAATGPAVSAFAVTVDLTSARKLLADFGAAGIPVTLDAMLIRAVALALESTPEARNDVAVAIGWETGVAAARRESVIADAHLGLLGGLAARVGAGPLLDATTSTALSLRRIAQGGVRPVAMPLLPGRMCRLIVSAGDRAATAECLLCFDAESIGEDAAAGLLARFRDGLEIPLRLLA